MSAHSSAGSRCIGCNHMFIFMDRHVPHCKPAADKMVAIARRAAEKARKAAGL